MLVIPAIDLINGSCVRLYQGDYRQKREYARDPVEQARKFLSAGFSRLHVIDLEGAKSGQGENRGAIQRVVNSCPVPVQVGGGIRKSEDVEELLSWGAEYLILSTAALEEPQQVSDWISQWGADHFIVSLDLRGGRLQTAGWLQDSIRSIDEVVKLLMKWELEQVICTNVECDGTLQHPDYQLYEELVSLLPTSVSLIAAGGISTPEHISSLSGIGVSGTIVGRALYEGSYSWEEMLGAG
jgi:phosphoribosylformimino-5-aminoimidazole carboxamide ribotide isomerase